jgi:hypothetical protein
VLGHRTVGVGLDHELEVTGSIWFSRLALNRAQSVFLRTLVTGGGIGTEDVLLSTSGLETGQNCSCVELSAEKAGAIHSS